MATVDDDQSGFQVHTNNKKSSNTNATTRVYIGNLPNNLPDLEIKIRELIQQFANVQVVAIDINRRGKSNFALVDCGSNGDLVVSKMKKVHLNGRKLMVQREKKQNPSKRSQGDNPNKFGSWSKPSKPSNTVSRNNDNPIFESDDQAAQVIEQVIKNEFEDTEAIGGDALNTAIASTAAMSLLASMNAFGVDMGQGDVAEENDNPASLEALSTSQNNNGSTTMGFRAQCNQPLSALLADYGEADPNWMKQQSFSKQNNQKGNVNSQISTKSESMLANHGKAPIHVDLMSFGYLHGAPGDIRNGWSHKQPLATVDCREYPEVPQYLIWQDGQSGHIKKALLEASDGAIRNGADDLSKQIIDAVEEAIKAGHGYVSPLQMVIHVGSHSGRHRSVVLCELAATSLRKLLRANNGNQITQPVSVGTVHRDINLRPKGKEKKFNNNDDDDNEWV